MTSATVAVGILLLAAVIELITVRVIVIVTMIVTVTAAVTAATFISVTAILIVAAGAAAADVAGLLTSAVVEERGEVFAGPLEGRPRAEAEGSLSAGDTVLQASAVIALRREVRETRVHSERSRATNAHTPQTPQLER